MVFVDPGYALFMRIWWSVSVSEDAGGCVSEGSSASVCWSFGCVSWEFVGGGDRDGELVDCRRLFTALVECNRRFRFCGR